SYRLIRKDGLNLVVKRFMSDLAVLVPESHIGRRSPCEVVLHFKGVDLLLLPEKNHKVVLKNIRGGAGAMLWARRRREWRWAGRGTEPVGRGQQRGCEQAVCSLTP